jgi:hypothetical protein
VAGLERDGRVVGPFEGRVEDDEVDHPRPEPGRQVHDLSQLGQVVADQGAVEPDGNARCLQVGQGTDLPVEVALPPAVDRRDGVADTVDRHQRVV